MQATLANARSHQFCLTAALCACVGLAAMTSDMAVPVFRIPAAQRDTGAKLYAVNCAPCHQPSGLGLVDQFPPLDGSEWVMGSEARLLRVIMQGLTGEIEVAGEMFRGAMPGWGLLLDDNQIAAVATFIRSNWGNKAPPVVAASAARVRKETAERKTPWTERELRPY
jgi:mono/diheme cytochrome c family protein